MTTEDLSSNSKKNVFGKTRNYYVEGNNYYSDIEKLNNKIDIPVSFVSDQAYLNVHFEFPVDTLFEVLDCVAFEVKLMENHTDKVAMSLGSKVDVISIKY